jgi:3-phosphoshikimate 1-carboxyvinyltransferase
MDGEHPCLEGGAVRVEVPGDKSLTQRALILASLAEGESRLGGLLHGGDAESTARALRALGAEVGTLPHDGGELRVRGRGLRGLNEGPVHLDLGNSGTGARLLIGVLAGAGTDAVITGDGSLRRRPMRRVTHPLEAMGAAFEWLGQDGCLPLRIRRGPALRSVDWTSPVASAQVKSAVLLAGLTAGVFVLLTEPRRSRDHTERLLAEMGVSVLGHAPGTGWRVELRDPPRRISPLDFRVPGDLSSAAFLLALVALGGARYGLEIRGVGLNPTRTGFLEVLDRMGVPLSVDLEGPPGPGEPSGNVFASPSASLRAVDVGPDEVPGLIDELPLVAVLGARAEGTTRITGAGELRHKESDRIAALVENLRRVGIAVEEREDGLEVQGSDAPLTGHVRAHGDHRITMAFAVLGAAPGNDITVDSPGTADVSFPGFWKLLHDVAGAEVP